jgi:hypothetical protein
VQLLLAAEELGEKAGQLRVTRQEEHHVRCQTVPVTTIYLDLRIASTILVKERPKKAGMIN